MECPIIPAPISFARHDGQLEIGGAVAISCTGDCQGVGDLLAVHLRNRLAITAQSPADSPADVPSIALDCSAAKLPSLEGQPLANEGYELTVTSDGIVIRGVEAAGVFYGVQSLLQLLPATREPTTAPITVPGITIVDAPRFLWRGVLLDCGRHFFPLPFIKKFLDVMALHKLNRFHWHLVEDQGWRVEVHAFPQLTNVGAWRGGFDGVPRYGGYYTQDEMREVVAYAAARHIEVVPEIELPGHCCSALASYPYLGCTGRVTQTPYYWGVHEDVYCAGKEEVFDFLEAVLLEIMDIFPCTYFHIGGDECPKVRWAECERCQRRIAEEGLADEFELQSWFVARIGRFLARHNRILIGWDEILEGTADGRRLPPNAVIMSWRGISGGVQAARAGHQVIMTPTSHCYLDYRQSLRAGEPGAWYALLPLEMVYAFEPVPPEAPPPLDATLDDAATASEAEAAPMSPDGGPSPDGDSDGDMEYSTADGYTADADAPPAVPVDDVSVSAASGTIPEEDLVSEPPMLPPDADVMLTAEEGRNIIGGQANVWTEYIGDEQTVEYMLLPRVCAMAEVLWSPAASKDWDAFLRRLPTLLAHFEATGLRYRALG